MSKPAQHRNALTKEVRGRLNELLRQKQFAKVISLLEPIYDGKDPYTATVLGFAWIGKGIEGRNNEIAMGYYRTAAEAGNAFGQQGYSACLKRVGRKDEALEWLKHSSDNGRDASSQLLYWHYRRAGNTKFSLEYLSRAAEQGHVLSAQRVAWNKVFGRYGISKIPQGFAELWRNSPKVIVYANDYMDKYPEEFEKGKWCGIVR